MKLVQIRGYEELELPFVSSLICAGFPSPADDFKDSMIDMNEVLNIDGSSTYMAEVEGDSMKDAGIFAGDTIIVNRALEPQNGDVIVAFIDGGFMVKRFVRKKTKVFLEPANKDFKTVEITIDSEFQCWGVVVACLRYPSEGRRPRTR